MTLLLGLDVGSTNVKAVIHKPDGKVVARATAATITHYPRPGWAFQRVDELWGQIVHVLRAALEQLPDSKQVVSLAVASVAEAGVPIDRTGRPLADIIAWFDTRPTAEMEWLAKCVGTDALFVRTGLSLQPIFGLCKMLWLQKHEPDAWSRTARWLNISDYVAYRLCGVPATGVSLASRTMALDLQRRCWDDDILRAVGMPVELFAPIAEAGTALGRVTAEATAETTVPTGVTVAVGGHDHLCGALAAGVTEPGTMLESLGTTDTLLAPTLQPTADPELGRQGFSQGAHVVPDRYYIFGGQYTLGASIEWFRETIGAGQSHAALIAAAEEVPIGSYGVCFLPHLRLANPPYVDPASRGAFLGLASGVMRPTLYRAVVEGLGFESRGVLEALRSFPEAATLKDARSIGGVTRNRLLMQLRTTIRNQATTVLEIEEATALGAAVLGGLGAGVYPDLPSAIAALKYQRGVIEPVAADMEQYDRIYDTVYRHIYATVAPLSQKLVALSDASSANEHSPAPETPE